MQTRVEAELKQLRIDKHHKPKPHRRRLWPWMVLILFVLVGSGFWWQWRSESSAPTVRTIRVRASESTSGPSDAVVLNATGYIMAAHKIELASKVVGRVAWVGVEMGDKIETNQVLVRLEDDEYKARVAERQGELDNARAQLAELEAGSRRQEVGQAAAELDQAQAQMANAESNLQRLRSIEGSTNVSPQELKDAETLVQSRNAEVEMKRQQLEMMKEGQRKERIDAQRATVRQLEGSLALATVELNNTQIRSPVTGTVLERNVDVGEFVTTGFVGDRGAKGYVVSIADLTDLRVELDVSQNDFAKVAPRQPCWIVTDAYPDRRYKGVVDLISPEANRQKATVEVRVRVLDPDELLRPDMNATVSFLSPTAGTSPATQDARRWIRVPAAAVRDGTVFIVENGKARKQSVSVEPTASRIDVEVRRGLMGGEELIVNPPETLQDGDIVNAEVAAK
jgi:HlyD family secretion protein